MDEKILEIINLILTKKDRGALNEVLPSISLRDDLEFDSLDLAELTVRLEDEFDVDIFENGIIDTLEEVVAQIRKGN